MLYDGPVSVTEEVVTNDVPDDLEPGKRGHVLVVYSGKGGIGRTTIALNLACALASKRGTRVALLDLDLQYGDVASAVDVATPTTTVSDLVTMGDSVPDADAVRSALIAGPGGVMILAAPVRPELADLVEANRGRLSFVLELLIADFDWLVIDAGRFLGEAGAMVMEFANDVLLVTTATALAMKNTRRAMEVLDRLGVPDARVQLVLNHRDSHSGFKAKDVEKSLNRKLAAELPHDSKLALTALDHGQPFVLSRPNAPLSIAIKRLAETEIKYAKAEV